MLSHNFFFKSDVLGCDLSMGQVINISDVCAKSLQLCLTLYDPMAHSLPGPSVHGILQARILEVDAMPSSRASS